MFGIRHAGLAFSVFSGWTYGVVATLVITTPGLAGLAVNFRKLQHDPTVEKLLLAAGAAIVVCAADLLLGERARPVALAAEVHRTDE